MILDYQRPKSLDEALTLLSRPNTIPLGGGTLLSRSTVGPVSVVDLQALGLNKIHKKGKNLEIGATVTLQGLHESEHCPEALKVAIKLDAPLNLRNSATLAGTLVACDGRSTLATALLALDAKIEYRELGIGNRKSTSRSKTSKSDPRISNVGDFLPLRPRCLITHIAIPLQVKFAFEHVARTPMDKPIVCAALAVWTSGRTRLAIGGFGGSPSLAMDGTEASGLETAARNACHEANDPWGSAEYRMDAAATLVYRCLETIKSHG